MSRFNKLLIISISDLPILHYRYKVVGFQLVDKMNKLILVLICVTMTLVLLNEVKCFVAAPLRKLKKYVNLTKDLACIEHPLNLVNDVFIE